MSGKSSSLCCIDVLLCELDGGSARPRVGELAVVACVREDVVEEVE